MAHTKLTVTNGSSAPVLVYVTLGATSGCVTNVDKIPMVTHVLQTLQGTFPLAPGATASYTSPDTECINGNLAFGTPPLNCATAAFPSGVNLFEFILNNAGQGAGAQETLDLSGVAGVNALLGVSLSGGGEWNAGPGVKDVTEISNKAIGQNVGRVGVYPYACDVCTASESPPTCSERPAGAPNPPVPQKTAICNVQRDASTSGGTVAVTYLGPA